MLRLSRWLLMGLCIPLLVLALSLTWLRLGINSHPLYHTWVQSQVSQAIGQKLHLDAFSVQLKGTQLQLQLTGITAVQELSLARLSLAIDVATSLRQGRLVLSQVQASGLDLNVAQQASGEWGPQTTSEQGRQSAPALMLALVQQVPSLWLHQVSVTLTPLKGPVIRIPKLNARVALDQLATQSNDGLNHISVMLYGVNSTNSGVGLSDLESHVKVAISPQQDIQQAQIYLHSGGLDIASWASALLPKNVTTPLKRVYVEGDYWLNYQAGKQLTLAAEQMQLGFESDTLKFELAGIVSATSPLDASSAGWVQERNWRLAATQLTGSVNDQSLPTGTLHAQNQQGQLAIEVPQLNLDKTLAVLKTMAGLPSKITTPILALAPSGRAADVQLHLDLIRPKEFLFQAQMQGASIKPWIGVPQIEQADGHIWLNRHGGKVAIIDDNGLSVRVVNLISKPWPIERLKGEFSWHYGALSNRFESSNIAIGLAQGQANLAMAAEFPRKGSATVPMLQLALGLQDLDLATLPELLPDRVIGHRLGEWLGQATPQGQVTQAALIYYGQPGVTKAMPIRVQATSPSLSYAKDWPEVKDLAVTVAGDSEKVRITAQSGHLQTPQLRQSVEGWQVQVPIKPGDGKYVDIQGHVVGEAAHMMSLAEQLPIQLDLPAWLHDAEPQGLVTVAGDVAVAYGHQASARYALAVSGEDLNAIWAPLQTDLRHIEFVVDIDSAAHGIGAISGSGLMDGQHIRFKRLDQVGLAQPWLDQIPMSIIDSQRLAARDLVIEFTGRAPAGYLSTKYQQPWLRQIPGQLPFVARLATCTDSRVVACSQLSAQIDLRHAALTLPSPINQLQQMQLLGDWHGQQQRWYAALDEHHLSVALESEGVADSSLQWVAGSLALQQPSRWVNTGEWSVVGQLDELDLAAWWQAYQTHIAPLVDPSDGAAGKLRPKVNLRVKHGQWYDVSLNDATLDFQFLHQSATTSVATPWRLRLTSEQLAGQIDYLGLQDPLDVQVDYANFNFPESDTDDNTDLLEHLDPSALPDANVRIDELVKNGESFGQWQFKTRRQADQVNVHDLEAFIRHAHLQGNLIWSKVDGLHQTQFTGRVSTSDIANMLIDWGYGASVSAQTAAIEVQIEWPHSPLAFALKEVAGDIGLRLKQGRFAESLDGAGGLKILALMDMTRLMNRVKLDFSDVIKPGFSFDSINAHYRFNQGVAQTVAPLALKSSSLNLTMNGWIDFKQRLVDNNLVVTLPVADKLPLAALIAGLPQLSGVIYIANKLIGDELATFTSARYQVSGSLDQPQVELVKIFDKDYQNQSVQERLENAISID
jgi:uncharacterized protein YhdP